MCGIFGFTALDERPAAIVVDGLKELEYRGYDSWGVAIAQNGAILSEKQVGKIGEARASLPGARSGLGHTRWATHGAVTHANAHPHLDCAHRLAVIHNGIVENYSSMRGQLLSDHAFHSETDTEVVAHMLEEELLRTPAGPTQLIYALMAIFQRLEGLSAIAVLDAASGQIAAAKNGSPLAVGCDDCGSYLASDPVVLLPHTRRLAFLEDGQAALLSAESTHVYDMETGLEVSADIQAVDWAVRRSDLGSYDHYMEKEIDEQPDVLRHLAAGKELAVETLGDAIKAATRVFIIGCGTANHAGLVGQYLMAQVAGQPVTTMIASEMTAVEPFLDAQTLVIALSQSGETIDVLEAVRLAQAHGSRVAALTNSEGSSLFRLADVPLLLDCGPERCVLATKTYTAMVGILLMTAWRLGGDADRGRRTLSRGALLIESLLVTERAHGVLDHLAHRMRDVQHMFILGRRSNYPLALEAALKVKEVSYIHAEGFAAGELKHGVIALVEPGVPCLLLATETGTMKEALAAAAEVRARGAYTIGFCREPQPELDFHVPIMGSDEAALFEVSAAFQMLAYRLALHRSCDPDKPRNLAKSVTVK